MDDLSGLEDLIDHLVRSTRLERAEAARLVREVLAYLSECPAEYVTRRHAELRREGHPNAAIYERLGRELEQRRFSSPALTERQIRRLIYG